MPAKPVNLWKPGTHPSPTFLFRQGMARLADDPKTARGQMSAAFDALPETDPLKLLAWASIVETYTLQWDDFRPLDKWISWLETRIGKGLRFADKEIEARVVTSMSKALMFRQPHHPDIDFWIDSALTAAREFADINFRVQTYLFIAFFYFWRGDLVRFRAIQTEIESLAALP